MMIVNRAIEKRDKPTQAALVRRLPSRTKGWERMPANTTNRSDPEKQMTVVRPSPS